MSLSPAWQLVARTLLVALLLPASGAWACVNTRYSREEERQLTGDVVKLIMGQFAHHGERFYRQELDKTAKELTVDPNNVEARNDRAVAHLKLGDYRLAEQDLLMIEQEHPGRYRTYANLGVLYKKMGRLPEAADQIRRSLEVQPEGHLGLGDYYLRMIDWLNDRRNSPLDMRWVGNPEDNRKVQPQTNFLGIAYADGWSATATNALVNQGYLQTLIKADRTFADAVLVLGDVLAHRGEKELAYRAYVRAREDLNHPALTALSERMDAILTEWTAEADAQPDHIVFPERELLRQLRIESRQAEAWVRAFEATETALLLAGKTPDFNAVKAEMKSLGKAEPRYIFAGVVKGEKSQPRDGLFWWAAFIAISILVVGLWILWLLVRGLYRWVSSATAGSGV